MTVTLLATACTVGPDYVRPSAPMTAKFKEAAGDWKQASPQDNAPKGAWWSAFGDPDLNRLEEQVKISNQTVKEAEAQYRQARALVAQARAAYFPTLSASGSFSRSSAGGGAKATTTPAITGTGGGAIRNSYNATLDAAWEPDIWGKIRRTVEENRSLAEASNADLAAATLSAQAELATDYLDLRLADRQQQLLRDTVTGDTRALALTQNQYKVGVSGRLDVLQAQTQLESAQAQLADIGVARTQFEHAIAVLVGKPPAEFSITDTGAVPTLPVIPAGVPSQLLERRPDIAGAERRMQAANAQIGIAKAAYYPDLTLSASGGYESNSLSQWFTLPNRIWSLGPSLAETLFDGGLRKAQTEQAIAAYDQSVATYRQTVLGAFQEVEDNLAATRILAQEVDLSKHAAADAKAVTRIALNQYKAGTQNYLTVVTAQNTQLQNELSVITVQKAQLNAAVTLIKGIGGGWNIAHPAEAKTDMSAEDAAIIRFVTSGI